MTLWLLLMMMGTPASVWECQRAMMRPDGTIPREAPCVCRARAGLPESKGCRKMREGKR